MNKLKRVMSLVVCLTMLVVVFQSVPVQAMEISPRYVNTSKASVLLEYSSNTASCMVNITGKSGTSKISGILKLYDETDKKNVTSWAIESDSYICTASKKATVKSGHEYTLSFSGTVYNASNVGEAISTTTTKKN